MNHPYESTHYDGAGQPTGFTVHSPHHELRIILTHSGNYLTYCPCGWVDHVRASEHLDIPATYLEHLA